MSTAKRARAPLDNLACSSLHPLRCAVSDVGPPRNEEFSGGMECFRVGKRARRESSGGSMASNSGRDKKRSRKGSAVLAALNRESSRRPHRPCSRWANAKISTVLAPHTHKSTDRGSPMESTWMREPGAARRCDSECIVEHLTNLLSRILSESHGIDRCAQVDRRARHLTTCSEQRRAQQYAHLLSERVRRGYPSQTDPRGDRVRVQAQRQF